MTAPDTTDTRSPDVRTRSGRVQLELSVADRVRLLAWLATAPGYLATPGQPVRAGVRHPDQLAPRLARAAELVVAPTLSPAEATELRVSLAALHAIVHVLTDDRHVLTDDRGHVLTDDRGPGGPHGPDDDAFLCSLIDAFDAALT